MKQDQRLLRVPTIDLLYVEALGDYVNIHTTRERLTVYGTILHTLTGTVLHTTSHCMVQTVVGTCLTPSSLTKRHVV